VAGGRGQGSHHIDRDVRTILVIIVVIILLINLILTIIIIIIIIDKPRHAP
jgi:hypothetical protein